MRSTLVILRREVQSYFVSPIAYAAIAGFLLISGYGFGNALRNYMTLTPAAFALRDITIQTHLIPRVGTWMSIAMLLCLPALSMRLFSEERRGGTLELLLTSPLTPAELVAGKYLGALVILGIMVGLTLPYLGILGLAGHPDWGALATTYLGYVLFGAVLLAIGLFASAVTENQIIAVIVTYAVFVPFFLVDQLINFVGTGFGDFVAGMSVLVARRALSRGVLDTHAFVLHGCLVFFFLFLAAQSLDSHRWR